MPSSGGEEKLNTDNYADGPAKTSFSAEPKSVFPSEWAEFRNQVANLAQVLEKMNLGEYISYLNSPRRMLLMNFGVGLLRGLGAALGATLLAGVALMLLKRLVLLNLPVIGGIIAELVKIVNAHNGY